jgi:hypothetical protein
MQIAAKGAAMIVCQASACRNLPSACSTTSSV